MIQQLGKGKFKLIVSVTKNGERVRRTKVVECGGKREANRLYTEFEEQVLSVNVPKGYTIEQMLADYIESGKNLGKLKATTLHSYECAKEKIVEYIGSEDAAKIDSMKVQHMVDDLSETLSPKTIKNYISVLSSSFERAIRLRQLRENPCDYIDRPKVEKPDIKVLDEADWNNYLECLSKADLTLRCAISLALFCGLRRSEICGIDELRDIDLNFKYIRVSETRHVVDGVEYLQSPKTKESERIQAMPDYVVEIVKQLIALHQSSDFERSTLLIQNDFGEPIHPDTLSGRIRDWEKKNNLPGISLHPLRHTFASMLLNSQKVDIAQISRELGHSNITTTLNTYTHVVNRASVSSRAIASTADEIIEKISGTRSGTSKEKEA